MYIWGCITARRIAAVVLLACLALAISGCGRSPFRPAGPSGPTSDDFYLQGLTAFRGGDSDSAVKSLTEATRRNPNHAAAHALLGDIYKQSGDYNAAAGEYEQVARIEPRIGDNHHRLAVAYHFLNRLKDAVASYLRAIRIEPTDWKSNMNLALAYSALGEHNSAVEHAQRATNLNPTSAVAHANLGVVLDARGNRAAAEEAYRKALELDPNQTAAAQNLAANLLDQNRPFEAITFIQDTLPRIDTPAMRRRYGEALAQAGRDAQAVEQYRKSLEFNPSYYPSMNGLAGLLIRQYRDGLLLDDRKRDEALGLWRQSLQLNRNQPGVEAQLRMWQPKAG